MSAFRITAIVAILGVASACGESEPQAEGWPTAVRFEEIHREDSGLEWGVQSPSVGSDVLWLTFKLPDESSDCPERGHVESLAAREGYRPETYRGLSFSCFFGDLSEY